MYSYFKLIDCVETQQKIHVTETLANGRIRYTYITILPGEKKSLAEKGSDDKFVTSLLKNSVVQKNYTPQLEELLKSANVDYTIDFCKTCGGKVKKLSYSVIEVV